MTAHVQRTGFQYGAACGLGGHLPSIVRRARRRASSVVSRDVRRSTQSMTGLPMKNMNTPPRTRMTNSHAATVTIRQGYTQ